MQDWMYGDMYGAKRRSHYSIIIWTTENKIYDRNIKRRVVIAPNRTHTYRHTALFEISNRTVGNITMHHLISCTIFLLMWDLQILLFGLWDSLVWRRSTEYQLCEHNGKFFIFYFFIFLFYFFTMEGLLIFVIQIYGNYNTPRSSHSA